MPELAAAAFLDLVSAQRGHFRLESGHHGAMWLGLDALFAVPGRIAPFVDALADALRPAAPDAVCGPLLGGAFLAQSVAERLGVEFSFTERVMPPQVTGLYQMRYRLPPAYRARVAGKRVAIMDDVMSAGSALRGTYAELLAHGATPVAAGALLILGTTGEQFFRDAQVPVHAVAREAYPVWLPEECPLCAKRIPLEDSAPPA